MFYKLMEILSIPIMILNSVGGIVGGIWLATLGEWRLIGIGIALLFSFHFALSLLMMPGLLVSGLAMKFTEKNKPLLCVLSFFSQIYSNLLIVGTCVLAFFVCTHFYEGSSVGVGLIPYVLWSWGMALGPWQFFASKEPDNEFSAITLVSASIFYFLFLASLFISPMISVYIAGFFLLVQLFALPVFNTYLASREEVF